MKFSHTNEQPKISLFNLFMRTVPLFCFALVGFVISLIEEWHFWEKVLILSLITIFATASILAWFPIGRMVSRFYQALYMHKRRN